MAWYIKVVNGVPEGGPQEDVMLTHSIPGLDLSNPDCGYEPVNRDLQTQPPEPGFLGHYEVELAAAIEMVGGMWTMVRKKRAMTDAERTAKDAEVVDVVTKIKTLDREFAVAKLAEETDPTLQAAWQQRITDLDNFVLDLTDPKLPPLAEAIRPPRPTP